MYHIRYKTTKGGSGVKSTNNKVDVVNFLKKQFKAKRKAVVFLNSDIVGMVYEDDAQKTGWNWYFDGM